jgi:hypothetical protein
MALVKNTGKDVVYFTMHLGMFELSVIPKKDAVEVRIGSNLRKSVKKGLDELELREIESRKIAREFAGIRGSNNSERDWSNPD